MSRRYGKCVECGGIYGHHMTGCPETPDSDEDEAEAESEDEEETEAENE